MMKKLSISYNNALNGECWTFYKFAILNSYSIAKPWLATHIEFYVNENMCGGYGDPDCEYYRMKYYADILSMRRIPVCDVDDNNIIDIICSEIENKNYIILYLNFNRIYDETGVSLHELLIYGYDNEKQCFYCPFIVDGTFTEFELSYKLLRESYTDAHNLYMQNGWDLLAKRSYYFGITSLAIREDYQNDNWVADYIDKIDHEIQGKRITQTILNVDDQQERVCYTGNACLTAVSNCLKTIFDDNSTADIFLWRLIRTLKMMYDYRLLFLSSIEWFIEKNSAQNNQALNIVLQQYSKCTSAIQRCYLLLCKFSQTKNIRLLLSTREIIDTLQTKEKDILLKYRELIWPYYYGMNGVPMPPEDN